MEYRIAGAGDIELLVQSRADTLRAGALALARLFDADAVYSAYVTWCSNLLKR